MGAQGRRLRQASRRLRRFGERGKRVRVVPRQPREAVPRAVGLAAVPQDRVGGFRPRSAMLALLACSLVVLLPVAYAQPVVGALYRMRYGLWMLLMLQGAMGWAHIFGTLQKAAERNAARSAEASLASGSGAATRQAVASVDGA